MKTGFKIWVRFLGKVLYRSLCCCTVNILYWHSKLLVSNRPRCVSTTRSSTLFSWIKLFKFLSLYRYIEITYLLAWERCFSPGRTMNVDEIRPIILWQALVKRTSFCVRTWGALSLIKFNYLVIWHCTNVINKSKKFLGLTVTVVCFRSICCRNCGF